MNIQQEINELKKETQEIEKRIIEINTYLYKDQQYTLSVQTITKVLNDLKVIVDKHTKVIESQQCEILSIQVEDRKARNKIFYMFLSLILIIIGKFIFNISLKG